MSQTLEVGLLAARDLGERDYARLLAPKLKALADETRLALILCLSDRPHTVRESPGEWWSFGDRRGLS